MAEQIQVDVHALQMEYAQQLTNEDFGEPRGARQMEDAQLLRDVEMGDPGNTHDVSWARHNRAGSWFSATQTRPASSAEVPFTPRWC